MIEIPSNENAEDQYEFLIKLDSGAYGSVYKASDRSSGETVAIKVVKVAIQEARDSIEAEIFLLQRCQGPSVVKLHDFFLHEGQLWVVQEFCEGGTLNDLMVVREKFFTERQISVILRELLNVLSLMHSRDVIHRDLKLLNLMLTKEGEIRLIDFGASHFVDWQVSPMGSTIGTCSFMAPEVVATQEADLVSYSTSADIWSLGIILLVLAEGVAPTRFCPTNEQAALAIKSSPPPILSLLPDHWSPSMHNFLRLCVRKLPHERPSAIELLEHPFIERYSQFQLKSFMVELLREKDEILESYGGWSGFDERRPREIEEEDAERRRVRAARIQEEEEIRRQQMDDDDSDDDQEEEEEWSDSDEEEGEYSSYSDSDSDDDITSSIRRISAPVLEQRLQAQAESIRRRKEEEEDAAQHAIQQKTTHPILNIDESNLTMSFRTRRDRRRVAMEINAGSLSNRRRGVVSSRMFETVHPGSLKERPFIERLRRTAKLTSELDDINVEGEEEIVLEREIVEVVHHGSQYHEDWSDFDDDEDFSDLSLNELSALKRRCERRITVTKDSISEEEAERLVGRMRRIRSKLKRMSIQQRWSGMGS